MGSQTCCKVEELMTVDFGRGLRFPVTSTGTMGDLEPALL
jgi:hypothetical protein